MTKEEELKCKNAEQNKARHTKAYIVFHNQQTSFPIDVNNRSTTSFTIDGKPPVSPSMVTTEQPIISMVTANQNPVTVSPSIPTVSLTLETKTKKNCICTSKYLYYH